MSTSTLSAPAPAAASHNVSEPFTRPKVVSREQWLQQRKDLLKKERELTHLKDQINKERRELPWVLVDQDYLFDTPSGKKTLADLFQGRNQLFVYHFMLAPDTDPCDGCCFFVDHVDSARQHFEHADLSFAAISRAPVAQIEQVRKRLGWNFLWASSHSNSFNYDYGVSFTPEQVASGHTDYNFGTTDYAHHDLPGVSVFAKDDKGNVYHTYSSYSRGCENLCNTFNFLDLTPKGRNESEVMSWLKIHDEYEGAAALPEDNTCCH